MRAPVSWLRDHADLPDVPGADVAAALVRAGFEVEHVVAVAADANGLVVGEVLDVEELTEFAKPIRYCSVEVGEPSPRGIVCGATNFATGDRVPVALPGATRPGGFQIGSRRTYGRLSDGMICSARELGLGDDHTGILVLDDTLPVGADAVEALRLRDDVLDIAVTPDRGYAWSLRGLAREAALAFGVEFRDPADVPVASVDGAAYDVRVEDPLGCDRYVARVVTGLDRAVRTPVEMRRRLLLAGMRPISLPVDVTNYVLLDLGQPLHAFDRDRLSGAIVVRRARAGERLTTLDGVDRTLDLDDLVIADESWAVALAGVMGGGPTEVGDDTTDLVIESAHFDPSVVARTARRHKLSTEASKRFERGVDDALAPRAAEVAVRLLTGLGGAKPDPGSTDVDNRPDRPTIRIGLGLPARVAGRPYDAATVRRRLTDVGCRLTNGRDDDDLPVTPPSWRPDLLRPIDLADEVIRLEGYHTVPSVLPRAPAGRGLTPRQRLLRALGVAMAGAGYVESPSPPFLAAAQWDALGLPADDFRRRAVELANPLDEGERFLRTTLLPGLLSATARNVSRGFPDLALFETGAVFLAKPTTGPTPRPPAGVRPPVEVLAALDAALPEQPLHLGAVLTGERQPSGWWGAGRPAVWADAVEAARTIGRVLAVPLDVRRGGEAPWHPGRCAEVVLGERVVGHAGELHPRVLDTLRLPQRTCAMELDLEPLLRLAPELAAAAPISTYPVATVDVALVVDDDVPAGRVEASLLSGGGRLVESLRLFDVYRGPQVGDGKKSLAFTLRLRAPDRTLTAEEAVAVRDGAVRVAAERTGAVLRG